MNTGCTGGVDLALAFALVFAFAFGLTCFSSPLLVTFVFGFLSGIKAISFASKTSPLLARALPLIVYYTFAKSTKALM